MSKYRFLIPLGLAIAILIPINRAAAIEYRDLNKNGQMDPYENPDLVVEDRVDDLISRMTLDEKVGQMIHDTSAPGADGMPPAYIRSYVQRYMIGFLLTRHSPGPGAAARCSNQIQEWVEESRLGIPVVISMDSVHGFSYVAGESSTVLDVWLL